MKTLSRAGGASTAAGNPLAGGCSARLSITPPSGRTLTSCLSHVTQTLSSHLSGLLTERGFLGALVRCTSERQSSALRLHGALGTTELGRNGHIHFLRLVQCRTHGTGDGRQHWLPVVRWLWQLPGVQTGSPCPTVPSTTSSVSPGPPGQMSQHGNTQDGHAVR